MEMRKPTLLKLREKYGISTVKLAFAAQVPPEIVYFMLVGIPVTHTDATLVLQALSQLTGVDYTLEDVHVVILAEEWVTNAIKQSKLTGT